MKLQHKLFALAAGLAATSLVAISATAAVSVRQVQAAVSQANAEPPDGGIILPPRLPVRFPVRFPSR